MMFSLIRRCGARRASATSLFVAALCGAGVAAQDDESEPAETVTGTVISGPVEASWVTSHGAMPVARGEFTLHAAGDLARLSIDLEATGKFAVGRDAESAWLLDPVAGPALLIDEDFAGWETVIGLVAGLRVAPEQRRDDVEEVQSEDREALRFETDSPHGGTDAWTVARDSGALLNAEIRVADGLGGFRAVSLRVAAATRIKNAEIPSVWALHLADFEYRLTPKSIRRDHEFAVAKLRLDPTIRTVARAAAEESGGDPAVTTLEVAEVHTATIRQKVPMADLSRALATMLPEVHAAVQAQGIRMLTAPFARYHSFGAEVDLEAGIVVATPIEEKGRVKARRLPGCTVATTWHVGPYHEMRSTHERIMGWLGEHGLRATGMPWEIYWTDPGLVTDPAQWRTQIFYPLGGDR